MTDEANAGSALGTEQTMRAAWEKRAYEAEARVAALEAERRADAGKLFKDFVHSYLDLHGVPHGDPESEHQKQGCRIGARLDILFRAEKQAIEKFKKLIAERNAAEQRADKAEADAAAMLRVLTIVEEGICGVCGSTDSHKTFKACPVYAAISKDSGRFLADLFARLRAAPCDGPEDGLCSENWPEDQSRWCFTCQAIAIGGGE